MSFSPESTDSMAAAATVSATARLGIPFAARAVFIAVAEGGKDVAVALGIFYTLVDGVVGRIFRIVTNLLRVVFVWIVKRIVRVVLVGLRASFRLATLS